MVLIGLGVILLLGITGRGIDWRGVLRGQRPLVRRQNNRMIAGVCGGLADFLGIDASVVRIVWAIGSAATLGLGVMVYVILLLVMPEAPEGAPRRRAPSHKRSLIPRDRPPAPRVDPAWPMGLQGGGNGGERGDNGKEGHGAGLPGSHLDPDWRLAAVTEPWYFSAEPGRVVAGAAWSAGRGPGQSLLRQCVPTRTIWGWPLPDRFGHCPPGFLQPQPVRPGLGEGLARSATADWPQQWDHLAVSLAALEPSAVGFHWPGGGCGRFCFHRWAYR
ncbi:MAG: PspC domain-containing protein [Anaerolineae bacterium]|nr:MAG: PspC domain-containing protein [Anaerolineae bacterium]